MINEEATFRWKGYRSTDLSKGSNKRVWAVCDRCGKGRWVHYDQYRDLCHPCAMNSDKTRRKISENRKKYVGANHPMYGKTFSKQTRANMSKAARGKKLSEEHKRKISESCKIVLSTTEMRKKLRDAQLGRRHSEETKKKIGEAQQGDKHHSWKGGVSFEPYCPKFNEAFKESIREKFGRVCFLCPTTEEENGRKLSIHHVQYEKNCLCDDIKCEFVPLCDSCHGKTNHNREHWEVLILEKLASTT